MMDSKEHQRPQKPIERHYKSDFDFILPLVDEDGTDIGFPAEDWSARLWTDSYFNFMRVSCIGGRCVNCFNDGGRIHVTANSHGLGCGKLRCEVTIHVPDSMMPDGERRLVGAGPLNIELVRTEPLRAFGVAAAQVMLPVIVHKVDVGDIIGLDTLLITEAELDAVMDEEWNPFVLHASEDGTRLYAKTFADYYGCSLQLLTCGSGRVGSRRNNGGKSRYRWHVQQRSDDPNFGVQFIIAGDGEVITEGGISLNDAQKFQARATRTIHKEWPVYRCYKANHSSKIKPAIAGTEWILTFAFAFYDKVTHRRRSPVRYFQKHYRVVDELTCEEWITV